MMLSVCLYLSYIYLYSQQGYSADILKFVPVGTFKSLRESINRGADDRINNNNDHKNDDTNSDIFMWDTLMSKPYHQSGEMKRIGKC